MHNAMVKNMMYNLMFVQMNGSRVPLEIYLLCKVVHVEGVIKILDYYEKTDSFIIIMERPEPVKDLFDYITEKGILDETVARDFFRQIVQTIQCCHKAGVIHRDIKVKTHFHKRMQLHAEWSLTGLMIDTRTRGKML
jgi:serine/threonine protein kinase